MSFLRRRRSARAFAAALLLALATSPGAGAYPIFYKCDANGRLTDHLDTRDIETAVLRATDEAGLERKLVDLCAGKTECLAILKQMLILTQSTVSAVKELLAEQIEKLEAQRDELNERISPELSDTARNVVAMSNEIYACRKAQDDLPDVQYVYSDRERVPGETSGYDLFIHHRVENEYRQYTGVKNKDEDEDTPDDERRNHRIDYDEVATVIKDAVAANVDPYAALAISLMEAGKPKRFKLDPSPLLGAMMCPKKSLGRVNHSGADADGNGVADVVEKKEAELRAAGVNFVYSFGTFYQITPGVREMPAVAKLMSEQKEYYDSEAELAPALACKQGKNTYLARPDGEILRVLEHEAAPDLSVAKACCVKIPYASEEFFSVAANVFLRDKVNSRATPEKSLQTFNGEGIIGGSEKEGVGAFRFGIHMGDDPQYGYQAMDTILNSLLSNSTIRYKVDEAKQLLGRNPKSVVCTGKSAGAYAIDNDHYLKKQKDIVRLKPYINRAWSELGAKLERPAMEHEMNNAREWLGKDHPKLDAAQNAALKTGLSRMDAAASESARWDAFRKYVYPYRKTLYQTSAMSWERLTNQETADLRRKILAAPPQK